MSILRKFGQSFFLAGRRHTFAGWYSIGLYAHIISGPFAIVLAEPGLLKDLGRKLARDRFFASTVNAVAFGLIVKLWKQRALQ